MSERERVFGLVVPESNPQADAWRKILDQMQGFGGRYFRGEAGALDGDSPRVWSDAALGKAIVKPLRKAFTAEPPAGVSERPAPYEAAPAEARPSKNLIAEVANALPGLSQSDVPEDEQERMRMRTQAGKAASTSKTQVSGPLPEPEPDTRLVCDGCGYEPKWGAWVGGIHGTGPGPSDPREFCGRYVEVPVPKYEVWQVVEGNGRVWKIWEHHWRDQYNMDLCGGYRGWNYQAKPFCGEGLVVLFPESSLRPHTMTADDLTDEQRTIQPGMKVRVNEVLINDDGRPLEGENGGHAAGAVFCVAGLYQGSTGIIVHGETNEDASGIWLWNVTPVAEDKA